MRYFDRKEAAFKAEDVAFDSADSAPQATNLVRITAADKDQAKAIGKARKSEAEREGGGGTIEMDLTVTAQAEAPFTLVGARPGVDGTYRITSVRHSASRSGGATTSLELKQPQDGAGKDDRASRG